MKFGIKSPFTNDKRSDMPPYTNEQQFKWIQKVGHRDIYPFLPKDLNKMNAQAFNPVIINARNGKWQIGNGISIYRRIAQLYIKYIGIYDEMCEQFPGYCIK